jgi:membrane protease YdiL (CAAX protease family)
MLREAYNAASDELHRLIGAAPLRLSEYVVIGLSVILVVGGNLVVVRSKKTAKERGPDAGEIVTLVAIASGGVLCLAALLLWGWTADDLGIALPDFDRAGWLWTCVVVLAALIVVRGSFVAWSSAHQPGKPKPRIELVRLLGGTAPGEEAIHRGLSVAVWSAAVASPTPVVVANVAIFTLWHVVGAYKKNRLQWRELLVTAIGAVVFLGARLAFGSLLVPWLLHAASNLVKKALSRRG